MKKTIVLLMLILVFIAIGCSDTNKKMDQGEGIEEAGKGEILEEEKLGYKHNDWSYRYNIEIDEKTITDEYIEVKNRDFKIVFAENLNEKLANTNSLNDKESLSGDRQDHLKIIDIEPNNISWTDGTVVTALIYEFKDIPENTNFKLEISNELREKLDLSSNIINIHIK